MKYTKITAAALSLALLSSCTKGTPEGWHCEELLYNTYSESLQITDTAQAHKELDPLRSKPLGLTDGLVLTGFFNQDVTLTEENADDLSSPDLKDKHYSDAVYGDTWYFTLNEPEKYLTLSDYMMPDYIRIAYAPKGSIIVNTRECVIISLAYTDESGMLTEAFAYTWFFGPDTTDSWDWNGGARA